MNLIRVLIIALLVWLVYRMISATLRKPRVSQRPGRERVATDMVRCEYCGIHIPKGEALPWDGHYYCCAEHRDQGRNGAAQADRDNGSTE